MSSEGKRYSHGNISCIDAIQSALSPEEFRGFCKGNVIKYIWREAYKGKNDDLDKAIDYCLYAQGFEQERKNEDACTDTFEDFFDTMFDIIGGKHER